MKYYDHELLYASESGTAYFFVEVLTKRVLVQIQDICTNLGFKDYLVHGYRSSVEDTHFLQLEHKV